MRNMPTGKQQAEEHRSKCGGVGSLPDPLVPTRQMESKDRVLPGHGGLTVHPGLQKQTLILHGWLGAQ